MTARAAGKGRSRADKPSRRQLEDELTEARLATVRSQSSDTSPAALIALGDALLDHDDYTDALAAYEKVPSGSAETIVAQLTQLVR